MAAEIGLLSLTQIQKLSQFQHQHHHQNQPQPQPTNPNYSTTHCPINTSTSNWMWNPREQQHQHHHHHYHHQEDDDSWEVRAFAEDTRNIMGTTWPPRSYTCTFCRREFRSAQALGGHMNVHRRDRARLHHHQAQPAGSVNPAAASSFINIPPQELVANAGLCFLYHLPSPNINAPFSTPNPSHSTNPNNNACGKSPPTLLSISSCPSNNLMVMPPSFDFPVSHASGINNISSYYCKSSTAEEPTTSSNSNGRHEELDLELRLGHRSTAT